MVTQVLADATRETARPCLNQVKAGGRFLETRAGRATDKSSAGGLCSPQPPLPGKQPPGSFQKGWRDTTLRKWPLTRVHLHSWTLQDAIAPGSVCVTPGTPGDTSHTHTHDLMPSSRLLGWGQDCQKEAWGTVQSHTLTAWAHMPPGTQELHSLNPLSTYCVPRDTAGLQKTNAPSSQDFRYSWRPLSPWLVTAW